MDYLFTKEEMQRRQRRHFRQMIGLAVVVLMLLGVVFLVQSAFGLYARLTDKTEDMLQYQNLLRGLVMYDPLPFEDLSEVDPLLVQESAIWGTIYEQLDKNGNLDSLAHDPETDSAILPAVDVDAFVTKLYGTDYKITHGSFTDDFGLIYMYDDAQQGYLVPVTSSEEYTPSVVDLQRKNGKTYVTVGYISNNISGNLTSTAASEPQKYMDYVFSRGAGRNWYLTALVESERKVDASVVTTNDGVDYDLNYDPTAALQDTIANDDTIDTGVSSAAASEAASEAADETAGTEATAEGETQAEETTEDAAADTEEAASTG